MLGTRSVLEALPSHPHGNPIKGLSGLYFHVSMGGKVIVWFWLEEPSSTWMTWTPPCCSFLLKKKLIRPENGSAWNIIGKAWNGVLALGSLALFLASQSSINGPHARLKLGSCFSLASWFKLNDILLGLTLANDLLCARHCTYT